MRTLATIDQDFKMQNGRFVWLEGIDALKQVLKNRISLGLGEWFLAPNSGVDWLNLVDQKAFLQERFLTAIKRAIRGEPNVKRIDSLTAEFDRDAREVKINFQVQSVFGQIQDSVII
jgi:hypothetical protein